jgi:hypothetical protein
MVDLDIDKAVRKPRRSGSEARRALSLVPEVNILLLAKEARLGDNPSSVVIR